MRPDLEQYYLIDQYLDNKLKGEDLIAFKNQLSSDASFANEVKEQQMLNNYILEAELKDVRNLIANDLANIQTPSFFRRNWQWIGIGILSISSIVYYVTNTTNTNKQATQESSIYTIDNKQSEKKEIISEQIQLSNNTLSSAQIKNMPSIDETHKPKGNTVVIDSVRSLKNNAAIAATVSTPAEIKHTPKIETVTSEAAKAIDCSLTKITYSITTETSCENTETGSIHIEKIIGGTAPYSYSLNNKKIKDKNILDLGAGTYEVKISDKNGCSTEHKAIVLEKNCTPTIQQGTKFNINPTIGETCIIPFNTDKKGNLSIYNRGGKVVHRQTNPSSNELEWNGTDEYGALAAPGLYVYLIEYTDGTKVTGEVNITR